MEAITVKILTHIMLIAVVCLSALFFGCIEEENHKIELPIDSPEETIEYAKTDNCTKEWIEEWSELDYHIIECTVLNNQSIWTVEFKMNDSPYDFQPIHTIKMHSNGTILSRWGGI
ncbi:MAG: hypothetical protein KAJ93_00910 [Methanosarcinales archaeon]|nr:hypothetical protein [Methanosarcinales archaeon]